MFLSDHCSQCILVIRPRQEPVRCGNPSLECIHDGHPDHNDVEGWHNKLNTGVATRGAVPFYHLVSMLYVEASDISLSMKMISEGKCSGTRERRHSRWRAECSACGSSTATGPSTPVSCCRGAHPFTDHQFTDFPSTKWRNYQWLLSRLTMHLLYILYTLYISV